MKIYARQVPPEHQESPLYMFNEWPENVYVFGNRHYTGRAERIDEIDGYSQYCYTYDPRAEIAAEYGVKPDEVQLYSFDGWARSAKWMAV